MATATLAGPWLSKDEAAEYTHLTSRTLERYVAGGRLPAYRMGPRMVRFRVEDLDALAEPIPVGDPDAA